MAFSDFINQIKAKAGELKDQAQKYRTKEFLGAALGGSALVAVADGTIDASEKQKMMAFIENHDVLSVFSTSEVVKVWKDFIDTIEMDKDIGEAKALEALHKIRGKDEQARLVMRMVCAIGAADGDFDADERRVAAKVARELGLDPSEFELA